MGSDDARVDWAAARGEKWRAHMSEMERQLEPVDGPLLDALSLDGPLRIVDVGCGGGATSREALRRAPAGSVVHGLDISPAMIDAARSAAADHANIRFEVADVATMAPTPIAYDRLVSRFGIMFYPQPRAAFANLFACLAPGGRFAFAVWAKPEENVWLSEVRRVVADRVELPADEPGAPGPFRYANAQELVALLGEVGFADVQWRTIPFAMAIGGGLPAADAARFALSAFSDYAERLAAAGERVRADAERALTARFSDFEHDAQVRLPAKIHVVTGARPR